MALRIRAGGSPIVCAAMHPEMPGDTYIDDGTHYRLSVEFGVLVAEPWEKHQKDGLWWWRGEVPAGRTPEERGRGAWRGEWCGRCDRRNPIGFSVADEVWEAVVGGRWGVLCATCFDEFAEAAGVAYEFGEVWPTTWADWKEAARERLR